MTEQLYLLTHVCKECGVKARVSKRSMRLYSHHLPDTTQLCPETDAVIEESECERVPIVPTPRRDAEWPAVPKKKKKRKRRKARRSESVWTVSGGLPGLGRRR